MEKRVEFISEHHLNNVTEQFVCKLRQSRRNKEQTCPQSPLLQENTLETAADALRTRPLNKNTIKH